MKWVRNLSRPYGLRLREPTQAARELENRRSRGAAAVRGERVQTWAAGADRVCARGTNALGILPTGAGKSLCYQLPALFLTAPCRGSPLIALMKDQHDHLEEANVEAARLDSTVPGREQQQRSSASARASMRSCC